MKKNGFFNLHTFPDSVIFAMWLSLIHKNKNNAVSFEKNESLNFKTNY